MKLKDYFFSLPPAERGPFADLCNTTVGHLRNVAYGKLCGEKLAVLIELHSKRRVTRQELRDDWSEIWPELKGLPGVVEPAKTFEKAA